MRAFPMMRSPGRAGGLRRHPQPATAGRGRRRHGRARRVHRAAGLRPASAPASTASSSKCTRTRRRPRATARTRCRSTAWRRCSTGSSESTPSSRRSDAASHDRHPTDIGPARAGPASAPDRGRAILGLIPALDARLRHARSTCCNAARPRHRHRHGQVRHHRAQVVRDVLEHRHARDLPARRRGGARRSRRGAGRRRGRSRCRTAARPTN